MSRHAHAAGGASCSSAHIASCFQEAAEERTEGGER